jgi:hypothetical protein
MHDFDHLYNERELNYSDTLIIDVMSDEEALDRAVEDAGEVEAREVFVYPEVLRSLF